MTFTYFNDSYIQLLKNKNAESIVLAIRHIFEYLNGVPHTIGFDNDTEIFSFASDRLKSLEEVVLPKDTSKIQNNAFADCPKELKF